MAFLLADAAKLTRDMLLRGVIETLITESMILDRLPFMTVAGSALDYNQELTLPSAEWHAVNDTWATSEPTIVQKSASLHILGGDADLDNFLQQTFSTDNNLDAILVQKKAKALAYAFNAAFFNGDSGADPNQFDGLTLQAGAPVVGFANVDATHRAFVVTANGALLDLATMDQLVDMVKPGKPDALFMSKRSRRKLSALRRASGNLLETGVDDFARRVMFYDGIPILIDENLPDNEVAGTSGAVCSSIYAVKFGAATGVSGLQNGGITTVRFPNLETKDGRRIRLKWYNGLAVFNAWSYCVLRGVKDS